MAGNVNISTVLKRELKDGKEYSKLIPRVSCKTTHLGEGDTFFTVDRMKDWIEKFRHQTAKLALRLEGRTVEETVNNIYNFLYNHIQYTADGSLQQLRSPACTWMQRKEGVDCKSYSVFASCILSNLGIKHAVRQVRQTYFYPEEFTHVYVVVFKDQSKENYDSNAPTFVIDATKHENTEVNYLEKVDLYMNKLAHVGLNAPQDERTARIIQNFESFCSFLLEKGASVEQVNQLRKAVSFYTSKKLDPRINLVYAGVQVEGVTYPISLTQHVPFLKMRNAFYGNKQPSLNGLGFSFGETFSKFSGALQDSAGSSVSSSSGGAAAGIVDAGIAVGANAVAPPPFGTIISGLLTKLELGKNISNVLKYGLSSWGASATPEEMKKRFAEICYPWLQQELAKTTMDNVDTQLTKIDVNLRGNAQFFKKLKENHSRAKSTRLANEWAEEECLKLLKKTIDGFNAQFQANGVRVTKSTVDAKSSALSPYPISSFWDRDDIKQDRYWNDISYFIYDVDKANLKSWSQNQMQIESGNQSGGGSVNYQPTQTGGGSNYQPTGSGQQNGGFGNDQPKSSGSNTGIIVGGVALAALPFLIPMMKGNPAAKAPAAKKPAKKKK